jgi:asparagine synthase (glutamine-hydrolysing)
MCGIFACLNTNNINNMDNTILVKQHVFKEQFMKGKNRGPEYSKIEYDYSNMILGFHRLAINGLNQESNQPIIHKNIVLICNGEIYNYKQLYKYMKITPTTDSDCEVIIHLYLTYGIEQTLTMLDGVYSFILFDNRLDKVGLNNVYVARDPLGIRPLYKLYNANNIYDLHGFASELKCLEYFYNLNNNDYRVEQFEPGTYSTYKIAEIDNKFIWKPEIINKHYFIPTFSYTMHTYNPDELKDIILINISNYLCSAVVKRCKTTERPIACLLSGGLDSSLIAGLVNNYYNSNNLPNKLETYSIGLRDSEDLKYAKIVANYLGTNHTEIIVTEQEMFDAIPEVIKAIESYDTTTVRASIGNYLIGKYIAANSDAKVIFNGDGSDELLGGYLYMHKCPDDIEFDKETRRLLKDIHLFDVLRSDKSISSNGLEPRTPFLDRSFVNYILSIPGYFRNHNNFGKPEKYLLRESFDVNITIGYDGRQILPDEILWRKKEAFSDGVSSKGRSLFEILQDFIAVQYDAKCPNEESYKPSIELEKRYYKEIFDKEFPNCQHIVPYFWMPKYTNAVDPSARTLDVYTQSM